MIEMDKLCLMDMNGGLGSKTYIVQSMHEYFIASSLIKIKGMKGGGFG